MPQATLSPKAPGPSPSIRLGQGQSEGHGPPDPPEERGRGFRCVLSLGRLGQLLGGGRPKLRGPRPPAHPTSCPAPMRGDARGQRRSGGCGSQRRTDRWYLHAKFRRDRSPGTGHVHSPCAPALTGRDALLAPARHAAKLRGLFVSESDLWV